MTTESTSSTPAGQWLKLTFFCPTRLLEPAADLLGVLSGAGVEQSPETEIGAFVSGFFQLPAGSDDAGHPGATAILAEVEARMTELFDVRLRETDDKMTREELAEAMATCDVLVPTIT